MQSAAVSPIDGWIEIAGNGSRFIQDRLVRQVYAESFGAEGFVRSATGNDAKKFALVAAHESYTGGEGMLIAIGNRGVVGLVRDRFLRMPVAGA